jgi:hypothetical protein
LLRWVASNWKKRGSTLIDATDLAGPIHQALTEAGFTYPPKITSLETSLAGQFSGERTLAKSTILGLALLCDFQASTLSESLRSKTALPNRTPEPGQHVGDTNLQQGNDARYRQQAYAWVCGYNLALGINYADSDQKEDYLNELKKTAATTFRQPQPSYSKERFKLCLQRIGLGSESISAAIDAIYTLPPGEARKKQANALLDAMMVRMGDDKRLLPFFHFTYNFALTPVRFMTAAAARTGSFIGPISSLLGPMGAALFHDLAEIEATDNPYVPKDLINMLKSALIFGVTDERRQSSIYSGLWRVDQELHR